MNCQELAHLLDEQDLHRLPASARAQAEAHLAGCVECARDHDMHLRLSALPVPPLAAERLAQWRGLAGADVAARLSRRRRLVLVGALTALAAAAAMLALRFPQSSRPGEVMAVTAPARAPAMQAGEVPGDEAAPQRVQEPDAAATSAVAAPAPPAPPSYTLLAMPLTHTTDDPLVQAAVRQFYAAVLDGLRQIPGLVVIGPDSSIDPAARPTSFTLWAEARPARTSEPAARWEVMLRLRNAERQIVQPLRTAGALPGECGTGSQASCGPSDMAIAMLGPLARLIPVDHAHENHLQARLLDTAQPSAVRLDALLRLRELDAAQRGAGFGPDLVRPLVDIAYKDASDELRLEAVSLLATSYAGNAAAKAALVYIARDDGHALVRKVAERSVNGSASWRAYSVATARDAALTSAQRLAPLHWMARNGAAEDMTAVLGELLDGDGAAGLAALLPHDGAGATQRDTRALLDALVQSRHPGAADFWLARVEHGADFTSVAGLHAHRGDDRVRAKLEDIASAHPDAGLRAIAASLMH